MRWVGPLWSRATSNNRSLCLSTCSTYGCTYGSNCVINFAFLMSKRSFLWCTRKKALYDNGYFTFNQDKLSKMQSTTSNRVIATTLLQRQCLYSNITISIYRVLLITQIYWSKNKENFLLLLLRRGIISRQMYALDLTQETVLKIALNIARYKKK